MSMDNLENSNIFGTQFTPFNDTSQPRIEQAINAFENAKNGISTREIDPYRQGVEIRTNRHRFGTTQPKIWSGNLNHYASLQIVGQARSFTEFYNTPIYNDIRVTLSDGARLADFNPIQYLTDPNYPFPIIFNNGPQQEEEASIEPIAIEFRRPSITGLLVPNSVKGVLEDGNSFDSIKGASNRIEQFFELTAPKTPRFFLDEGQQYFEGIVIEGYVANIQREISPYNETRDESIVEKIRTTDQDFIGALKALKFDYNDDIREGFDKKSNTAGYDSYGPSIEATGTDSIAFSGLIRGA